MYILTDRPKAAQHLLESFSKADKCAVIGVHQALTHSRSASVVICDVALDSISAAEVTHSALASIKLSKATGIVFLARDPSQLTAAQAKRLGAHVILPADASHAEILEAARKLKERAKAPEQAKAKPVRGPNPLTLGVSHGTETLTRIFKDARDQVVSMPAVEQGGNMVITAIRQSDIQAWLDIVWQFDDVTYQHCMLVAGLVAKFAHELPLALPHQRLMSQAALLHDVGKARIPQAILCKPGALTPDEWKVMKTHTTVGYALLAKQSCIDPQIMDIVRHHHEYLDGSGYPDQLKSERISQFVRMTTICDIYAALIERRPYKAARSPAQAFAVMHEMGGKLDTALLATFERMMSRPAAA